MEPLIRQTSIDSLKAVVGIAGVRRLAVRFEAHLLPRLDQLVGMSDAELKLEAHSLRGSALLLGMSALAEELRAVEDSGQWRETGQSMRDLSEKTIRELWRILDE